MFNVFRKEIDWGGRKLVLETGKVARQADGAVMATYGETTVLCTVVAAKAAKPGVDFFPLTVNYQEKAFAAGKIPGGFFKREARPTEKETLTARLIVQHGHLRPGGTVSGPAMFALADVAIYLAILSRIGEVALAVTTNASIDFMRKPAAGRDLLAECRILKLGRSLAVGECLIFSEGASEPAARCSMTYSIPPKQR